MSTFTTSIGPTGVPPIQALANGLSASAGCGKHASITASHVYSGAAHFQLGLFVARWCWPKIANVGHVMPT